MRINIKEEGLMIFIDSALDSNILTSLQEYIVEALHWQLEEFGKLSDKPVDKCMSYVLLELVRYSLLADQDYFVIHIDDIVFEEQILEQVADELSGIIPVVRE